jgi:hypothetical protein
MIIVTRGVEVVNSEKENVVIIFENDEQRKLFAKQLTEMPDKNNVRVHATYNPNLCDAKKLIDDSLKCAGYERGIDIFS